MTPKWTGSGRAGMSIKTRVAAVIAMLAVAAAGCGGKPAGQTDASRSPSIDCATANQADWVKYCASASPVDTSKPPAAKVTVKVIWMHVGKFFGDPQVWYVARVTNHGSAPASVALNAKALDKSGTIVGSLQPTLPNIPAGQSFDFFGYLGGGGAFDSKLTGKPATLKVTRAEDAFGAAGAVYQPLLATKKVHLKPGHEDTYTDAPRSYNLTAVVKNTSNSTVDGGVTQQVVLYDTAGRVVGGDTGSSDNVPDSLGKGESYREKWTGIPAVGKAASVKYSVWAGIS